MSAESNILIDRALMLKKARHFFDRRKYLEVDTPALVKCPNLDPHIEPMQVGSCAYLHTSPEYGMKRLLTCSLKNIYQISHVFRKNEVGALHNPEFTMAEWYRQNISTARFINETAAFIRLFLGPMPLKKISYRKAFMQYAGVDCFSVSIEALKKLSNLDLEDRDTLLQQAIAINIEPNLPKNTIVVIYDFPSSQAALARINADGKTAARFEFYCNGIELANGYHELDSPQEQRARMEKENTAHYPLDEKLLLAMEKGIGNCHGIAAGFDRLMMLRHNKKRIEEVLPIAWEDL